MAREVRVSPDGNSVAIRSDWPADAWNAFGVMNALNGGYWADSAGVSDWSVVTVSAPTPPAPTPPSE